MQKDLKDWTDGLKFMGKLFFFDADGTILDIKKGVAPDVPQAIRRLTERGHMAFLCTGRSRAFVPREIERLGFTGMITNLGAYIEYQGKAVYDKEIPLADAKLALETLRGYGLVPVMEGNAHMYYDKWEYTNQVDWYADLITRDIGSGGVPLQEMKSGFTSTRSVPNVCPAVMLRLPAGSWLTFLILSGMKVHLWEVPLR